MASSNYSLDKELSDLAAALSNILRKNKITLSFAESCTGGLASYGITKIKGASDFFLGAIVAYSDTLKEGLLNVKKETLAKYSAESIECAKEMLSGLQSIANSDISAVTTGVAGPDIHNGVKRGTIFFGFSFRGKNQFEKVIFTGNRDQVMKKAVIYLYKELISFFG